MNEATHETDTVNHGSNGMCVCVAWRPQYSCICQENMGYMCQVTVK